MLPLPFLKANHKQANRSVIQVNQSALQAIQSTIQAHSPPLIPHLPLRPALQISTDLFNIDCGIHTTLKNSSMYIFTYTHRCILY